MLNNPYSEWVGEYSDGLPHIAQVNPDVAQLEETEEWQGEYEEPAERQPAPTAPGVPVPPPIPRTKNQREYVEEQVSKWSWRNLYREPGNVLKEVATETGRLLLPFTLGGDRGFFAESGAYAAELDRVTGRLYNMAQEKGMLDTVVKTIVEQREKQGEEITETDPYKIIRDSVETDMWESGLKGKIGKVVANIMPGWQDMVSFPLLGVGENLVQELMPDGTLPPDMRTAFAENMSNTYDFRKPEAREAFTQAVNEGRFLSDYVAPWAALVAMGGKATGAIGKGGKILSPTSTLGRLRAKKLTPQQRARLNRRLGLPADAPSFKTAGALRHKINKSGFIQALDKTTGVLEKTNQFINEGGLAPGFYSLPIKKFGEATADIPGLKGISRSIAGRIDADTGKFRMESGLADIIDPESWAVRGAISGVSKAGTKLVSPYPDMVNKRMMDLFKKYGVDPKDVPASLISMSEDVAQVEGIQLNLDNRDILDKLRTSLRVFQAEAENIAETFKADGDLTKMGKALEEARQTYDNEFKKWAKNYRDNIVPGSENVAADLVPIFQLRQEMELERQRLHESGDVHDEPTATRYLDDLIASMQRVGQAGLTEEAVDAMQQGQPPPQTPPQAVKITTVRTENQLGMPNRMASSPDYKTHYDVEYAILPNSKIITSHTWDGRENPLFAQAVEHLGLTRDQMQPREYKRDFVRSKAQDLQPIGVLADMRTTDRGAPIVYRIKDFEYENENGETVTEDVYLALAGNNRLNFIEMARHEYTGRHEEYRTALQAEAGHYGFNAADITNPDDVLVRRLVDQDADLPTLVNQSNTTAIRLFDAGEQSVKDMQHLNEDLLQQLDLNFSGRLAEILQNEANIDVVFEWLKRFDPAEAGNMTTTEIAQTGERKGTEVTTLSEIGVQRLVNALIRRTYSGSFGRKMIELFVTRQDSDIRNIENGIMSGLQDVASLEIGIRSEPKKYDPKYSIAEDIARVAVEAYMMVQRGKQDNLSKTESIAKGKSEMHLFNALDEEHLLILDAVQQAIESPGMLTRFIEDYVAGVKEHGSPEGLFAGMTETPSRQVLLEQLHNEYFIAEDAVAKLEVSEPEADYEGEAPAPLKLWYLGQAMQNPEYVEGLRERQRQQEAQDIINEVEQLAQFDTETTVVDEGEPLAGLAREGRAARKVVSKAINAIMDSERIVSIEWEGFIPDDNWDAARAEIVNINGIDIGDDPSLRADMSLIEDVDGNILPEYEEEYTEATDRDEFIPRFTPVELRLSQLQARQMEQSLQQLFEILNRHGAKVNQSAGFHVHVDKRGMTGAEMANILNSWMKYEAAIVQQPGWENNYSASLRSRVPEEAYLSSLQEAMKKGPQAVMRTGPPRGKLNISGSRGQTIEFRQGDGTLDYEQAMNNVTFALGFVEKYRRRSLAPPLRALGSTPGGEQVLLREADDSDYSMKGKASAQRETEGRSTAGRRRQEVDLSSVAQPVTYGQLEAWRTHMRREKEKHEPGSPQHVAASRMEEALRQSMERTMLGYSPDMWDKLENFYRLYHEGAVGIKSKVAKAIARNSQQGLVEGTSNYAAMARTLFSPGDTPANVNLLYQLIGGRDSEAGRQVRAVFLENLMEQTRPKGALLEGEQVQQRTEAQRQAVEQAQRAVEQATDTTTRQQAQAQLDEARQTLERAERDAQTMHPIDTVQPTGLSGELEKWMKKTGRGYKRKTLDAILGKEVVDALIDLRDVEQSFARLKAAARGSRTAPWLTRFIADDAKRARLSQIFEVLGSSLTPYGLFFQGGVIGGTYYFTGSRLAAVAAGAAAVVASWLGGAALEVFKNSIRNKPVGERYLLEGSLMALDHVLTKTPIAATPEQAKAHEEQVSAEDYAGPRHLWEYSRAGRFIEEDENR